MIDTINSLHWRYAVKMFNGDILPKEKLEICLESLRLSASSFGLQPWKFVVVSNPKIKEKLVEFSYNQSQVQNCSHLIVFAAPTRINETLVDRYIECISKTTGQAHEKLKGYGDVMKGFLARMDEGQKLSWAKNQIYIALGTLLTVCAYEKIDACPMEGIIASKYDEVLGLKESQCTTVVACPIGHRSSEDKYATSKKVRFTANEVFQFVE